MGNTRSPLATAAAMASGTIPGWFPLSKQSPLTTGTDYFDDGSLDGAWSTFDPGSTGLTVTETVDERLKLVQPTQGDQAIAGVVRAAPGDSAYCITAYLGGRGRMADYGAYGIVLGGSDMLSDPTNATLLAIYNTLRGSGAVPRTAAIQCEASGYVDWTTFDSNHVTLAGSWFRLLRVFYTSDSGGLFHFLGSQDGNEWLRLWGIAQAQAQLGASAEAPAFAGVFVNNFNTGDDLAVTCPMYRVDTTTDMFLPCGEYFGH